MSAAPEENIVRQSLANRFFEKLKAKNDRFLENSVAQRKLWGVIGGYYAHLAAIVQVSEDKLEKVHFSEIIEVFKTQWGSEKMSKEERNRILGEILATDILKASERPDGFLEGGDAWLSKHLIAALIRPEDENFTTDMIAIFKIALCDREVIKECKKLFPIPQNLKHPSIGQNYFSFYLNRIFPSAQSESTDPVLSVQDTTTIFNEIVNHINAEEGSEKSEHRDEEAEDSSITCNFLLTACCPSGGNLFAIGTLIFLFGLVVTLSPLVTALPTLGLSVIPSVGVGVGAMVVGGSIMMASMRFFSPPKSPGPGAKAEQGCGFRLPYFGSSVW